MEKPFIIRIGGVSQAGKGTLSKALSDHLNMDGIEVDVLEMDCYVHEATKIPKINKRVDWESPDSINWPKLIQRAKDSQADILIIEGIFAFCNELHELSNDLSIRLQVTYETFIDRRSKDDRWGDEPQWYLEHVWESNLKLINDASVDLEFDQSSVNQLSQALELVKERIK